MCRSMSGRNRTRLPIAGPPTPPSPPPRPPAARRTGTAARVTAVFVAAGVVLFGFAELEFDLTGIHAHPPGLFWTDFAKAAALLAVSAAFVYRTVRRQELIIAQSAELLRAVSDGTTDALFVKDLDGRYLMINEAGARFIGRPVEEIVGRDDAALLEPAGAKLLRDRDLAVMAGGGPDTREEEFASAGATRVYQATKAPYRDASGAVVGLIGVSRDITEQKRTKDRLRMFRALLDHAHDAIEVIDPATGRYLDVNEIAAATKRPP